MRLLLSPFLFKILAGQLLALVVLYTALHWLLPIIGAAVFGGMTIWNHSNILFCWLLQYAFIATSVELRDTLVKKAALWLLQIPITRLRLVLALASLLVLWVLATTVWVLVNTIATFSFAVVIELLLLVFQVWCLCGAAVPMSAKRFYVYFFQRPVSDSKMVVLK